MIYREWEKTPYFPPREVAEKWNSVFFVVKILLPLNPYVIENGLETGCFEFWLNAFGLETGESKVINVIEFVGFHRE